MRETEKRKKRNEGRETDKRRKNKRERRESEIVKGSRKIKSRMRNNGNRRGGMTEEK